MHLPFTVTIEWPTPRDLRSRRFWLFAGLAIGVIVAGLVLVRAARTPATRAEVAGASLAITSAPSGATILVAGRERGLTPATLALPPGEYRVTLRLAGRADTAYSVRLIANEATSLDGLLWLRTPETLPVRPPLPGATIASAQFLDDGRVALAVALPSGDERQLWLLERDGTARRIGPPLAHVAIAAAPDGSRVAYLARPAAGSPASAATVGVEGLVTELWVTARDGERGERRYALPANTAAERLVDLAWAPDGTGLLLASQQRPQGGGARTRLLWLDLAAGSSAQAPRDLITLPSDVVPGAYAWSPQGERVALLARANGKTTLCLLARADGTFRPLADLATDGRPAPSFPPLTWREGGIGDGGAFAYAAPPPGTGSGGFALGTAPAPRLFTEGPDDPGTALGAAEGLGPGWRGDGLLLALVPPGRRGSPILRAYDPRTGGAAQDLGVLPPPLGTPDSVRWDLARGQALIAVRRSGGDGQFDLWLVRWGGREGEARP